MKAKINRSGDLCICPDSDAEDIKLAEWIKSGRSIMIDTEATKHTIITLRQPTERDPNHYAG